MHQLSKGLLKLPADDWAPSRSHATPCLNKKQLCNVHAKSKFFVPPKHFVTHAGVLAYTLSLSGRPLHRISRAPAAKESTKAGSKSNWNMCLTALLLHCFRLSANISLQHRPSPQALTPCAALALVLPA